MKFHFLFLAVSLFVSCSITRKSISSYDILSDPDSYCCDFIEITAPDFSTKVRRANGECICIDLTERVFFYSDVYDLDKISKPALDTVVSYLKSTSFEQLKIQVVAKGGGEYDFHSSVLIAGTIEDYFIDQGINKEKILTQLLFSPKIKHDFSVLVVVN